MNVGLRPPSRLYSSGVDSFMGVVLERLEVELRGRVIGRSGDLGDSSGSSEADETRPSPGPNGVGCGSGNGVSSRRHDRAKTPIRRIRVPRAMRQAWRVDRRDV